MQFFDRQAGSLSYGTKKARCLATPGFGKLDWSIDQASQEQTARARNIHGFTYQITRKRDLAFLFVIQTWL
jgi:hypothetical protein